MKVSPLRDHQFYFLNDLDPDGCLVADQLRACTKTLESTGADKQKGLIPIWRLTLQKKDIIFCDGEVFSLDRGLLMGAINTSSSISTSSTYIVFVTKLQKKQIPQNGSTFIRKRYHNQLNRPYIYRYIARLSKKSKKPDFSKFAYNDFKYL